MVYTGKRQAQAKGKVEKIFDYFHPDASGLEAQKILDDLVRYYNEQRTHEETNEAPLKTWQTAIANGKGDFFDIFARGSFDWL